METFLALSTTLLAGSCLSSVQAVTYSTYSTTCVYESDGWCDSSHNYADCNYDGGDCCECDCVDSTYTCGVVGYDCVDPFSSCQSTVTFTSGTSATCLLEGDGWCDTDNNNADCNYDGGDCCECDCVDTTYTCGIVGYSCFDPASTCQYHHYYDDDGTFATDDDDDYIVSDDSTFESEDDNDINRTSPTVTDDDGNDAGGDDAPVGIIVGGAAGGAVFLGALAVLACCIKTGRLKNCCSGGGAAGSAVPPRAQAQAPTTGYAGNGAAPPPATVGTAADRPHAQSFAPPPAYTYGGPGPAPSVQAYPISKAPPPAYED